MAKPSAIFPQGAISLSTKIYKKKWQRKNIIYTLKISIPFEKSVYHKTNARSGQNWGPHDDGYSEHEFSPQECLGMSFARIQGVGLWLVMGKWSVCASAEELRLEGLERWKGRLQVFLPSNLTGQEVGTWEAGTCDLRKGSNRNWRGEINGFVLKRNCLSHLELSVDDPRMFLVFVS